MKEPCDFEHPHPGQPCGQRIIAGVTRCPYCGNLDHSPECDAAGCWEPFTEADLDALKVEGMEQRLPHPGRNETSV